MPKMVRDGSATEYNQWGGATRGDAPPPAAHCTPRDCRRPTPSVTKMKRPFHNDTLYHYATVGARRQKAPEITQGVGHRPTGRRADGPTSGGRHGQVRRAPRARTQPKEPQHNGQRKKNFDALRNGRRAPRAPLPHRRSPFLRRPCFTIRPAPKPAARRSFAL